MRIFGRCQKPEQAWVDYEIERIPDFSSVASRAFMRATRKLVQRELLDPHILEGSAGLTTREWRSEIEGQTALMALDSGSNILGVAFMKPSHNPDPEQFETETPYLSLIAVNGKHQGMNIGRSLLQAAEAHALELTPDDRASTILRTAPVVGSVAFYEGNGYAQITALDYTGQGARYWGKNLDPPNPEPNDIAPSS